MTFSNWCNYCGRFTTHGTREHFCIQCHVRPARRQFCSDRCYYRDRYLRHYSKRRIASQRRYYTLVRPLKMRTHTCQWPRCGRQFESVRRHHKFCSVLCSNKSATLTFYNRHKRKPVQPFQCPCGTWVRPRDGRGRKIYCSDKCTAHYVHLRFVHNNRQVVNEISSRSGYKARLLLRDSYVARLLRRDGITPTPRLIQITRQRIRLHRSQRIFSLLNAASAIKRHGARKQN